MAEIERLPAVRGYVVEISLTDIAERRGVADLIKRRPPDGESALVHVWFVNAALMASSDNRSNAQVEAVHREMSSRPAPVVNSAV